MIPVQSQRAVAGRPFAAAFTFGLDGDGLPDAATAVTVLVTNAAGVTVTAGTASLSASVASRPVTATFALTPAQLPGRDVYLCAWTATIGGVAYAQASQIDVCDARLFDFSEYAAFPELAERGFSDAELEAARLEAEDRLELECGVAFTGRYATEQFTMREPPRFPFGWFQWGASVDVTGRTRLLLRRPFVQRLRSITQTTVDDDGNPTVASLNLAFSRLDSVNSIVLYRDPQNGGLYGDLTIAYEHGMSLAAARRVCLLLARYRLLHGPLDERAIAMPVQGGGSIPLITPGLRGSIFGIPEIDVFIERWNQRVLGIVSGLTT